MKYLDFGCWDTNFNFNVSDVTLKRDSEDPEDFVSFTKMVFGIRVMIMQN